MCDPTASRQAYVSPNAFAEGYQRICSEPSRRTAEHRATIIGPGATPDVVGHGSSPDVYDASLDRQVADVQSAKYASDGLYEPV